MRTRLEKKQIDYIIDQCNKDRKTSHVAGDKGKPEARAADMGRIPRYGKSTRATKSRKNAGAPNQGTERVSTGCPQDQACRSCKNCQMPAQQEHRDKLQCHIQNHERKQTGDTVYSGHCLYGFVVYP